MTDGYRASVLTITEDELAAEALAASSPDELPADAVPFSATDGDGGLGLLPSWYMPSPMVGGHRLDGWRRRLAMVVVLAFLALNAAGLCSTYGVLELA